MYRIVEEKIPEIIEICRRHRVKTLKLFEPATGEWFDPPTSDLDSVVSFEAVFARPVDQVEMAPIKNLSFRNTVEDSRIQYSFLF